MASSSGRVGATEGSSPGRSRPPDPCLDCLHDLLSAAKRLRGCEALPNDLAHQVSTQCREVHRVLEKADGRSLRLLDVLCSRHSGDINDKLNAHLLTLCFKHLECADLCRAAGVCKLWRQVASSDECWDALLRRLPISNFIVNEPPSLRRQNGSRRVASRLRYLLYRSRSGKWDDHEDFRDRFVVDSTYLPQAASPLKLVAFEDKHESVVVSSTGQKAFPLVVSSHSDEPTVEPRERRRLAVRAFPALVRGGGRWTVRLKRFLPTAVNAIGIAAECERGRVVWLFNTDGTDSPITEASLGADAGVETRVEVLRWHGFGEVVAPSFWTVGFSIQQDRLVLECGMREQGGCPLVERTGLVRALAGQEGCAGAAGGEGVRCSLVMLLQDSKASVIDIRDW